jgi:hypothetical protein
MEIERTLAELLTRRCSDGPSFYSDKKITEEIPLASSPLRFFSASLQWLCPSTREEEEVIDSHNPNSLMVAELAAL